MKTGRIVAVLIVLVCVLFCGTNFAAATPMGTAFTYQGRLIDNNDVADGLYDFQFSLYDSNDPCDCTQVGNDVNVPDMDVIDGYFTVLMDFNDANAFEGDARWLKVGVRPGDQNDPNVYIPLRPRQEVTPAPYALYALESGSGQTDGDWTISDSNIYSAVAGNVGIGTSSPATALHIYSATDAIMRLATPSSEGSSVIEMYTGLFGGDLRLDGNDLSLENYSGGDISFWTDTSAGMVSRRMTLTKTGYLGIGEIIPTEKLEVSGTVKATAFVGDGSGLSNLPAVGDSDWAISDSNMSSIPSGNVGIGTSSPDNKLTVGGTIKATTSVADAVSITGQNTNSGTSGSLGTGVAGVAGSSESYYGVEGESTYSYGVSGSSSYGRAIYGESSEGWSGYFEGRSYIGDVGFEPIDSNAVLQVSGSDDVNTPAVLEVTDNLWQSLLYVGNDGNVGIGTTNPTQKLDVVGRRILLQPASASKSIALRTDGADLDLTAYNADLWIMSTTGNTIMQRWGGNVGIGTTSPEFKLSLDDDGGIFAQGTYGSGASLTTSGAGARLIWYPRKAAFRAGMVDGGQWDDPNIANFSTVSGGRDNTASNSWATVGGGDDNIASGDSATISGGWENTASSSYATVGGGMFNTASGDIYATVGGGYLNAASARSATVPGGRYNTAGGDDSFAAGRRAKANHDGSFVWADKTDADFASTATDQFLIRASGGVGIGTASPAYDLDVNGDIRAIGSVYYGGAEGNADGTAYPKPDYVFEQGYDVMSTEQVEEYLKEENHLPWLTSAKAEKEENGDVIDMTRMAFETVETAENLQIQIMELHKRNKELEKRVAALEGTETRLAELERLLSELAITQKGDGTIN